MARISSSIPNLARFTNSVLCRRNSKPEISSPDSSKPSSSSSSQTHQCLWLLDASKRVTQVCQIHSRLVSSGLFDSFWARKILKVYWDFGDFDYTVLVFRYVEFPGTFCVNTIIKAYSLSSTPRQALVFYFQWLRKGFAPNSHTFAPLVSSCAKIGCAKSGKTCHGQAIKNGVEAVIQVRNSLVHMYSSCGEVETAHKVFDEMSERDIVSWNSLVDGYTKLGDMGMARRLFETMPERNVASWNVISGGYLKAGIPGNVLKLFREMAGSGSGSGSGSRGNGATMVNLLTACGRSKRLIEGRSVHGFLIRTMSGSSVYLDTALIDMYSKCWRLEDASRVFDAASERNLICWNAMILGHCLHGNPEDGISLYAEMLGQSQSQTQPDEVTFIGVLCACARAGKLEQGQGYFRQMTGMFKLKPNFAHYWCLANLFASSGNVQLAEQTIRGIPEDAVDSSPDSLALANLLSSCRFQNEVSLGEEIARCLIEKEPRKLAYYVLLVNVYAVAGRWQDVAAVKETLRVKAFGSVPGCNLVDLKEIVHNLNIAENWLKHNAKPDFADLARYL